MWLVKLHLQVVWDIFDQICSPVWMHFPGALKDYLLKLVACEQQDKAQKRFTSLYLSQGTRQPQQSTSLFLRLRRNVIILIIQQSQFPTDWCRSRQRRGPSSLTAKSSKTSTRDIQRPRNQAQTSLRVMLGLVLFSFFHILCIKTVL